MLTSFLDAAGGLGLLLLGMSVMTVGLRGWGGGAMRRNLVRFTHSPSSGAVTGAVATALLQSSSATTVVAVGFVGAGVLSYSQALGVVFGANIGTTATGWLVALFGIKFQLGQLAYPLVLAGALVRMFARGHSRSIGSSMAGFGLIFIGISVLQQGMHGLEAVITPSVFPDNSWLGRVKLVLIGAAITVVTQSSSAGVAAAVVAVSTGSIEFGQAAALVIGMDIGTTVTAVLATIGASAAARRTGYSHVIYNLMTGVGAFFLLDIYIYLLQQWLPGAATGSAELALVGFHTLFNLIGVVAVLPVTGYFASAMVRLVPERSQPLLHRLDSALLSEPDVALDAAKATLDAIGVSCGRELVNLLRPGVEDQSAESVDDMQTAIKACRRYLHGIRVANEPKALIRRHLTLMHMMDHLARLVDRCDEARRARATIEDETLQQWGERIADSARRLAVVLSGEAEPDQESCLYELWQELEEGSEPCRERILTRVATQQIDAQVGSRQLKGVRWLRRVAYHLWRIEHHLNGQRLEAVGSIKNDLLTLPDLPDNDSQQTGADSETSGQG